MLSNADAVNHLYCSFEQFHCQDYWAFSAKFPWCRVVILQSDLIFRMFKHVWMLLHLNGWFCDVSMVKVWRAHTRGANKVAQDLRELNRSQGDGDTGRTEPYWTCINVQKVLHFLQILFLSIRIHLEAIEVTTYEEPNLVTSCGGDGKAITATIASGEFEIGKSQWKICMTGNKFGDKRWGNDGEGMMVREGWSDKRLFDENIRCYRGQEISWWFVSCAKKFDSERSSYIQVLSKEQCLVRTKELSTNQLKSSKKVQQFTPQVSPFEFPTQVRQHDRRALRCEPGPRQRWRG